MQSSVIITVIYSNYFSILRLRFIVSSPRHELSVQLYAYTLFSLCDVLVYDTVASRISDLHIVLYDKLKTSYTCTIYSTLYCFFVQD